MSAVVSFLTPKGRTTRGEYWLIVVAFIVVWLLAWSIEEILQGRASFVIIISALLMLIIHTVRRLHDARFSRWWAAMMFFPISISFFFPASISIELSSLHVSDFEFKRFDFAYLLRSIPFLLAGTQPSAGQTEFAELPPAASS